MIVVAVQAQLWQWSLFGLSARAVINIATMKFDPDSSYIDYPSCLFFHGGVVGNYAITPIHLVQMEIYYDPKRCNAEESGLGYKYEYRLNYLNIPVLYRIQALPSYGIYGTTGFQMSFLKSAKESWEGSETDVKDYYKNTDFGRVIGAGANLPFRFSVDIHYILGLMDVYYPQYGGYFQIEEKRKNNVLQFSARFRIIGNHLLFAFNCRIRFKHRCRLIHRINGIGVIPFIRK